MSGVIPALLALGTLAVLCGAFLLRSVAGYRVARTLRAAPEISIAEAVGRATAGDRRYVRVRGRIGSAEEFPDENDRPLVFRRRRLEVSEGGGRWKLLEEERTGVPFTIEERGAEIWPDLDALDEGVVVIPRESTGLAREIPGRVPEELPGDALIRHRIDQVSAVEYATAAGVPVVGPDRRATLTAGSGRPLILTTLEMPHAMRVLSGEQRARVRASAGLLIIGAALVVLALAAWLTEILRVS
jgi:hypothetical protein